jgi:hypothetical protein
MAERATRAAAWGPRLTVRAAARVLPGGPVRERYRQEFLAELPGLGRARQARHALGVLSRSWALRAAVSTPSAAAADMEIVFPRRRGPLSCRLNLRHRWETVRTEDGSRYRHCQRCGKDETDMFGGTKSGRDFDGVPPGIGYSAGGTAGGT